MVGTSKWGRRSKGELRLVWYVIADLFADYMGEIDLDAARAARKLIPTLVRLGVALDTMLALRNPACVAFRLLKLLLCLCLYSTVGRYRDSGPTVVCAGTRGERANPC